MFLARRPGLQVLLPYKVLLSALKRAYSVSPGKETESEGHAIRVVGVVVVGVAVAVDIAEIVGVAAIRRTLPPVVRRQGNKTGLDPQALN